MSAENKMRNMNHLLATVVFVFFIVIGIMLSVQEAGAVNTGLGTNATLKLFDDGDIVPNTASNVKIPGLEINNLFNDTSNVYFYANYTNGTGSHMTPTPGTICNIEFTSEAGGNTGPFTMVSNATLQLFEYNRSFQGNGTFAWNVTCGNTVAGTANVTVYDNVRIFGPGCTRVGTGSEFPIINNTILCRDQYLISGSEAQIDIGVANITLDCNGSIIESDDPADDTKESAIAVRSKGVIVKNCNFAGARFGVKIESGANQTLLYNNTFENNTRVAINITGTSAGNTSFITIDSNNFTGGFFAGFAIDIRNATNINITRNIFANNHSRPLIRYENVFINTTDNNTIQPKLISTANNTDQYEINFTFNIPTLGFARTCDLALNVSGGSFSGRTTVLAANDNDVNVTFNRTFFSGDRFTWQVNCTDPNNNTGNSVLFNSTYRACTLPIISGIGLDPGINVTFCPGTFRINISSSSHFIEINNVNDSVISCNNTIIIGNSSGDLFSIVNGSNRVRIQHCLAENYSTMIKTQSLSSSRNVTIFNNTFSNASSEAILIHAEGFNLTNNTIANSTIGVHLINRGNHTLLNNTIKGSGRSALIVENTSSNTVLWNNLSFGSENGIIINVGAVAGLPASVTRPEFVNLIANNTVCGFRVNGLSVENTRFSTSPIMDGLIANNTFCNTTTGTENGNISRLMWNIDIQAVNATNTSMVDVNINITNLLNRSTLQNVGTPSDGIVSFLNITQFIVNNSNILVNESPTTLVGAKNNEKTNLTLLIDQLRIVPLANQLILNLSQDNTPPNVTQISPTTANEDTNINFSATVVDQTGIQSCSLFAGTGSSITNRGVMTYSLSNGIVNRTLLLADPDTYTIYANCTDNGGNIGFNTTLVEINDTTPPNASVISPLANNFTAMNSVVNITVNGSDNVFVISGQANITYPNNTTKETLTLQANDSILSTKRKLTFNYSFGNTSMEGHYNVTITVLDQTGNLNTTEKTNFTVDSTGPAITNINPVSNTTGVRNGTVINISVNVSDLFLNVEKVFANITYPDNSTKEQVALVKVGNIYNFSFANTTAHGLYNITFIANDTAGNLNTSEKTNFTSDDANPQVSEVTPTSGTAGSFTFTATVTDNIGIESCNLFVGVAGSETTNQGAMTYSSATNLSTASITLSTAGAYTVYSNCTDTSGNIGLNSTSVSVSLVSGGGGDDGGDEGGSSAGGGGAAPAAAETATETAEPAAEETAPAETAAETGAEAAAEAASEGDGEQDEEEEIEAEAAILAEEGGIEITSITANDVTVYENGEQVDTVTIKDEDVLVLEITITNPEEGVAENLEVLLKNLPESISIEDLSPEIIEALEAGETQTIRIELESGDVTETFSLDIEIRSLTAYASVSIGTVLEEGKGQLYYTRQKIIEETKEVVIRTYKILFLLFLVPILLLLRATTIVDENALRRMIDDKKLGDHWRVYVPEQSYLKYNMFQNLKPIHLEEDEVAKANQLVHEGKISYSLATMILYANKKMIPRVFTLEKVSDEIRHKYPRVYFTSPLRDYREEQLQRYVEMQKKKGYKSNDIREALLAAKWDAAVVKKYLNPEEDLAQYIAEQQKQGKSLGELRKELLEVKWDKAVVDKHIPRETVLKEYIAVQRKTGKTNEQLRKELIKVGWEKELVKKYLNPENDLKAYVVSQQHKGVSNEQIKQQLIKGKWKKEVVERIFSNK
ncbi:right-handed parallel beta-helix repeat-containing protein [Candidatus Woesearchaeota archaeon]|nr:right-handed parallel beta-helix repeat-containing protein [Candidatus Woesearchaeota archaeon]